MNVINTRVPYNSYLLTKDIYKLLKKFPFISLETIGKSVLEKPIYAIRIGKGLKEVFYSASIHANEWITSLLLMKFVEDFCIAYTNNSNICKYSVSDLFNLTSIYIVPMINPDGVDLVTNNYNINSSIYNSFKLISEKFPLIPFPNGWKANFNGVDLNLQFPAGWEISKKIKHSQGFNGPSPRDFVGYKPLTEPEVKSLYNFTLLHNFRLVISLHTQGQEIYWNFKNKNPPKGYYIGKRFAASSGYILTKVPYNSSFAGYKDWFIQEYNRPGYTIECGLGENPLPISQFDKIYADLLEILILGATL